MTYPCDGNTCPLCSAEIEFMDEYRIAHCYECTADFDVHPNRDYDFPYDLEFTGFGEETTAADRMRDLLTTVQSSVRVINELR